MVKGPSEREGWNGKGSESERERERERERDREREGKERQGASKAAMTQCSTSKA